MFMFRKEHEAAFKMFKKRRMVFYKNSFILIFDKKYACLKIILIEEMWIVFISLNVFCSRE